MPRDVDPERPESATPRDKTSNDCDTDNHDDNDTERHGLVVSSIASVSDDDNNHDYYEEDEEEFDCEDVSSIRRWRTILSSRRNSKDYDYDFLDKRGGADEEEEEEESLNSNNNNRQDLLLAPSTSHSIKLCVGVALLTLFIVASLFLPNDKEQQSSENSNGNKPVIARKYKGAPQYICPSFNYNNYDEHDETTGTESATHVFDGYQNNSALIQTITSNTSVYKDTFRTLEYMNWNKTYNEVKESLAGWKERRFLPFLKTGDSVFESGCGIGLSLLMTAELLQEKEEERSSSNNIIDLHLYGTDFGTTAAATANLWLDAVLNDAAHHRSGGGKRGAVCAANSTRLTFIPDNSFDFVFASRITPPPDPWDCDNDNALHSLLLLNSTTTTTTPCAEIALSRRRDLCSTKASWGGDWKSDALLRIAQERHTAWHAQWVSEMIRIAKPGVPIVVEHVSDPYCDSEYMDDWAGGVDRSFWRNAIVQYNWEIDPESLELESDDLFPNKRRYHVFMRKKHSRGRR